MRAGQPTSEGRPHRGAHHSRVRRGHASFGAAPRPTSSPWHTRLAQPPVQRYAMGGMPTDVPRDAAARSVPDYLRTSAALSGARKVSEGPHGPSPASTRDSGGALAPDVGSGAGMTTCRSTVSDPLSDTLDPANVRTGRAPQDVGVSDGCGEPRHEAGLPAEAVFLPPSLYSYTTTHEGRIPVSLLSESHVSMAEAATSIDTIDTNLGGAQVTSPDRASSAAHLQPPT